MCQEGSWSQHACRNLVLMYHDCKWNLRIWNWRDVVLCHHGDKLKHFPPKSRQIWNICYWNETLLIEQQKVALSKTSMNPGSTGLPWLAISPSVFPMKAEVITTYRSDSVFGKQPCAGFMSLTARASQPTATSKTTFVAKKLTLRFI